MKKALAISALIAAASANANAAIDAKQAIKDYTNLVYLNYQDAYQDAKLLQDAIEQFTANPTEENLDIAKETWLESRDSYGQTEAFRFYEGPIDFVDDKKGIEGPEGRLNAWPLNEAHIDYVVGNENAGIINDLSIEINAENVAGQNQLDDEADVATGYHAIEFLLWGQDLSINAPGNRPVSDYIGSDEITLRRAAYLSVTAEILVDDLEFLVDSWKPYRFNYAMDFKGQDGDHFVTEQLSALATLAGFELASERMATALDSGDQEDEHSCFSDNTHNDFIYNIQGIKNVYLGNYANFNGQGLVDIIAENNPKLANKISKQIDKTLNLAKAIPAPIDREVLATKKGSEGRKIMENAVKSLQVLANLFIEAGDSLGLDVKIMSE